MSALVTLVVLTFGLWALISLAAWGWKKFRLINPQSEKLFEAGISRQLAPRFDPFIISGSRLYIIGSDGRYAFKGRGIFWLNQLGKWAARGCTIHYLLCSPDYRTLEMYGDLAQKYDGIFNFYVLTKEQERPPELKALTARYETFHPTLLDVGGGGGRAMWIENYHPLNSEFAFQIDFVSPKDGQDDQRFDLYLRDIQTLIKSAVAVKGKEFSERERAAA